MASRVSVFLINQRLTGLNRTIGQRAVDVTINWVDDAGGAHTNTQTVNFPDILGNAALPAGWLQDQLTDLCLRALRIILEIDTP